jgi:hypothetical protein
VRCVVSARIADALGGDTSISLTLKPVSSPTVLGTWHRISTLAVEKLGASMTTDFGRASAWAFSRASKAFRETAPRESFARGLLQYALSRASGSDVLGFVLGTPIDHVFSVRTELEATGSGRNDLMIVARKPSGELLNVLLELKAGARFDENQMRKYEGDQCDHLVFIAPDAEIERAKSWQSSAPQKRHISTWDELCRRGNETADPIWEMILGSVTTLAAPTLPKQISHEWWKDVTVAEQFKKDLQVASDGLRAFNAQASGNGKLAPSVNQSNDDFWIQRQWKQQVDGKRGGYIILMFDPRWERGPMFVQDDASGAEFDHSPTSTKELKRLLRTLANGKRPAPKYAVRRDPTSVDYMAFTAWLWAFLFEAQRAVVQLVMLSGQRAASCERGMDTSGIWIGSGKDKVEYRLDQHLSGCQPLYVGDKPLDAGCDLQTAVIKARSLLGL